VHNSLVLGCPVTLIVITIVAIVLGAGAAEAKAPAGPAAVVRAWTAALNRGDNEADANLFAKNAVVVQNGLKLVLFSHHVAVLWMQGLPCSGRLVRLTVKKDVADATFVLGTRQRVKCDAPGIKARALFRVRKGRIVAWAQVAVA
jgi:limonene-1,2-epoxide hydrolase